MAPFALLVSLALAAAPHLARAQTPSGATSSAFTPLASKSFDWNNLVRFFFSFSSHLIPPPLNSRIKPTPMTAFVAVNTVITAATRRPKTNSRSVRLLSSTRLMVSALPLENVARAEGGL